MTEHQPNTSLDALGVIALFEIEQALIGEIRSFHDTLRGLPPYIQSQARTVLHEHLTACLFWEAKKLGYIPLLEFKPFSSSQHRIDVVWVSGDTGEVVAGFEIDKTVYKKSIRKLLALPSSATKIIVSTGAGRAAFVRAKAYPRGDIYVVDLTKTRLAALGIQLCNTRRPRPRDRIWGVRWSETYNAAAGRGS